MAWLLVRVALSAMLAFLSQRWARGRPRVAPDEPNRSPRHFRALAFPSRDERRVGRQPSPSGPATRAPSAKWRLAEW